MYEQLNNTKNIIMNKKPLNHFESYEAACADRGYNPDACIPQFKDDAPEWLKTHLTVGAKLLVIADAIRQGRLPKYGDKVYFPIFYKSGSGFSGSGASSWRSGTNADVGARLEFFTYDDAKFFGQHYIALHKITKGGMVVEQDDSKS